MVFHDAQISNRMFSGLQELGSVHDPCPLIFPGSLLVSFQTSPTLPTKRKLEASLSLSHDTTKRLRTSVISDRRQSRITTPPALFPPLSLSHISHNEPSEDGELSEEPTCSLPPPYPPLHSISTLAPTASSSMIPVRRPKRGKTEYHHHEHLHDKYHDAGRKLKYSGDARFWSTYPTSHKEYRPLATPPPPNSSYHKYGGLIARLELVDALVCFTYAIWNKEYARKNCYRATWGTIDAFLSWCKQKWLAEEGILDAEKALIGLIYMIEAFVNARKLAYLATSHLEKDVSFLYEEIKSSIAEAATKAERELSSKHNPVPSAMLPSPASIAAANSANSTPNNSSLDTTAPILPQRLPVRGSIPEKLLPDHCRDSSVPAYVMEEMIATRAHVSPGFVQNLREQTIGTIIAGQAITQAQTTLNISTLFRYFPNTFSRIIYSTLFATEEHEPDFEDEEGELFWPGQCINGEGLGWVCLLGKAMIKEFGAAYGYRGLDGVVPKPKPGDGDGIKTSATYSHTAPRQSHTAQGHYP